MGTIWMSDAIKPSKFLIIAGIYAAISNLKNVYGKINMHW